MRLQVLNSGEEAKRAVGKYLAVPALRRVIATFQNDPSGAFADWATNPQARSTEASTVRLSV